MFFLLINRRKSSKMKKISEFSIWVNKQILTLK